MSPTQHFAYISDIGAQYLKPLFIAGCVLTVITLDASIIASRWLRHRGYLVRNTSRGEKILSGLAIGFALVGAAGLILLSIFDTLRHPKLHDGFLLFFIGGYVLSAIFSCAEYQRLGVKKRQHRVLRISFWIKLAFVVVELLLAICFASLTFTHNQQSAAYFEWVIAFIFTLWVLSFAIDLLPVVRRGDHSGKGPELMMSPV
jgi:Frag1/DRAM/Sfk1 family